MQGAQQGIAESLARGGAAGDAADPPLEAPCQQQPVSEGLLSDMIRAWDSYKSERTAGAELQLEQQRQQQRAADDGLRRSRRTGASVYRKGGAKVKPEPGSKRSRSETPEGDEEEEEEESEDDADEAADQDAGIARAAMLSQQWERRGEGWQCLHDAVPCTALGLELGDG